MKNNSGSVLITVLAVSIIMSALLVTLFSAAAWSYRRGMGKLPETQAHYTAMAGIKSVVGIIKGENAYGDILAGDPNGIRTALYEFIKDASDEELEISLNFGDGLGRCDLTLKNLLGYDVTEGEVEISSRVVINRMVDESGQLKEGELYGLSLTMGWSFEWEDIEDALYDYLEYELEELPENAGVYADDYFWFVADSAAFSLEANENPLDYVQPVNNDSLFIFINPGSVVNFGNIGWTTSYSFDVYVILTGDAAITGLSGLWSAFLDYDDTAPIVPSFDEFPENTEQEDKFWDGEWHILHYKNPLTLAPGDLQFDDTLTKADIFDELSELGLEYWMENKGLLFYDDMNYAKLY